MSKKIKILSGWSAPGGSTVAFINLCNLFNERGYDCTFYGPHEWHLDKCKAGHLSECPIDYNSEEGENLIVHYLKFPPNLPPQNKVILACHEKDVFPVKEQTPFWTDIVYVSNAQMFWQGVPGKVIPNVVSPLSPTKKMPLVPHDRPSSNSMGRGGFIPPSYQCNFTGSKPGRAGNSYVIRDATGYVWSFTRVQHASTDVGWPNFKARNTGSIRWQPMSPSAPVPKSHQPRHLKG